MSRDLAASPCFSAPGGGLGLRGSAPAFSDRWKVPEKAYAVAAAGWLSAAVSSTTKVPGILEIGPRSQKRVDPFLPSLVLHCSLVDLCFGMQHSPTEEENKAGLVGVDDGFGESDRGDEGGLWNCFVV